MTIILPSSSVSNKARIGYENLFESASSVSVTSAAAGFDIENAYDWLPNDFWKAASTSQQTITVTFASSVAATYFAHYNTNLHTASCSIVLQYYNGSIWVDAFSAYTPADNAPRVTYFSEVTSTQWRVIIGAGTEAAQIGVLSFGEALLLQYGSYMGYTEPKLGRKVRGMTNISEAGAFLGRSIVSHGFESTIELNAATDAFTRNYWLPFVEHAEQKPFFFTWDYDAYPNEAAFCWSVGDINAPSHAYYGYSETVMRIMGVLE